MEGPLARLWNVLVGVTLVSAAAVVVVASTGPGEPVTGVSTLAALAAVFAVGFVLAAALRLLAGEQQYGVGNLAAVVGWVTLFAGEVLENGAVTAAGVVVVLAAGAYLMWLSLT
ncbi:MAG: hypothetical protein ABEH83_10185 [Halobacterium sp.]